MKSQLHIFRIIVGNRLRFSSGKCSQIPAAELTPTDETMKTIWPMLNSRQFRLQVPNLSNSKPFYSIFKYQKQTLAVTF